MNSIEELIEKVVDKKVDEKLAKITHLNQECSDQNRFMTIAEAAKFIKVSTRTIYNYLDTGVFNRIYFGNSVRIDKMEIISFANLQKAS